MSEFSLKMALQEDILPPVQEISTGVPDLSEEEKHRILVEWNDTAREYPRDKCIHHLFEEQVERTPDSVAVVFQDQSLTYRELNSRANQLAHHLRSLGVGPEVLVGLCVERSLEMIVALLGILKAGGAYVPIDPDYPAQRVAFMIADAGAPVLLTQRHLVAGLPTHSAQLLVLDEDLENAPRENLAGVQSEVTSTNLAYMIYTSGSTGQPKGALNTHRGICNRLLWMQDQYELTPADVVLQKTPFSFDVSVWEFFWPLMSGARLVLAKPGGHMDADYLVEFIRAQGVTSLHFVPPMLRVFLQASHIESLRSIRQVFCGGDALAHDLQEKFFGCLDAQLHNLYGPTEAAIDVTHWTCRRNSSLRIVPIGRPVANTRCYILDARLQPVPVGTPGELYLGGVQVGRGYHNRPELTAERFIPDLFSHDPEARLYKTGDLACYLPDGNIEYLGRLDHQIKIRGFRIELGEIESALGEHPDISACVVVTRDSGGEDQTLAAFVVGRDQGRLSVGLLRRWLGEKLPDYMIPSHFYTLTSLPLMPNGKLDRKALEKLDGVELATGTDHVPPSNDLESKLVHIWQTVLRRERVGIHDSFFELGGHSLLAMAICSKVNPLFGMSVPLRWVFDYPTIEGFARRIESQKVIFKNNDFIGNADEQRGYWAKQLQDLPPALELPTDMARPARMSGGGATHEFQLAGRVVTRLRDLARAESTTVFTVMLAAFQVWLHRYTGETDVVVGTPIINREQSEVPSLPGLFLNTLPIRTRLDGSPSFREVLSRVRGTLLDALSHADLPFEKMVELKRKESAVGHHPIYQVVFVLIEEGLSAFQLDQVEAQLLHVETRTTRNDLTLCIEAVGETWSFRFEYATDLFTAETAARMGRHLTELLQSITEAPEKAIGLLNLMSSGERHQVTVEWNDTVRDYPRDKCIHQLFEEQVERTPDAVAVVFENQSLTYRELNARANQLTHHLIFLGVGPDGLVGLCVERSLEMTVALLGILKAGGAYVALDPDYPKDRLAYMLENSACAWLVTETALKGCLPDSLAKVICLEDLPNGLGDENLSVSAIPGNLAYVLYTSGSTGQPKGVAMEHGSLVNLITWELNHSKNGLRTLQFASLNFDVSFQEMFSTWLSGGTLILIDPHTRLNPAALWEFIAERNLERLFLPVIMLQYLVEASACSRFAASTLREIITAGEQLRITPDIRDFFAARPELTLHNHYGPTESHVVTALALPSSAEGWPELPPIGKPIFNATIHLLDKHMNPVPIGVPGELYIGGAVLARGYWKQPERTAERFVKNPFSPDNNARLYQTGDLARYRSDGEIEYLGRTDHQVKIRGFRVELEEIEAWMRVHPNLSACVVVAQSVGTGRTALTAFLVLRKGVNCSLEAMRLWAADRLPDYMIPSRFCLLKSLPLTPSGKLDRKALEKLDGVELATGTDHVPPSNDLECKLVEIWQTVLRRERVGIHDNFFALGGHSLLAVAIYSKIRQLLELEVPLRWVFDYPTIEGLANQMRSLTRQPRGEDRIKKTERQHAAPMSFAQQGMWLTHQTLPDQAAYNQPIAFRLSGHVDQARARRALEVIVERHEILRTALLLEADALIQRVFEATAIPFPWDEIDLRSMTLEAQRSAMDDHLLNEARRPFDLSEAPLWRAVWIQLGETEQVLMITFHHSIVDEWSQRLLILEWEQIYKADGRLEMTDLPALSVQYSDYAVQQRLELTDDLRDRHRVYWSEALRDLPPPLDLPCQRVRPKKRSGHGAVHGFQLTGPILTRIRETALSEGTTLFTVMLAAFHCWLHRYTGLTDIVVATPITHRSRQDLQSLLGFFLNTLPVRLQVTDNPTFRKVIRQVRETLLDAFSHADLPFEQIVELALKERTSTDNPIFQKMFVLLEEGLPPLSFGEFESERIPVETQTSKSDLMLSVYAVGEAWNCYIEYATDLLSETTVASLASHFQNFLHEIAVHPEEPIGQLKLLGPEERQRILVEWNDTARDYPRDKCVHQLFEEQVERTPDAVAVVFESQSLTYRELNARANQLAHHLISSGVGPDILVGVCVERSLEMITALLGILKAGGAYVPLDPHYPAERLNFILKDSRTRIIVAEEPLSPFFTELAASCSLVMVGQCRAMAHSNLQQECRPSALAYVIYTSGSTGEPKGVAIEHRNAVSFLHWVRETFTDEELSGVLAVTSICFDISVFELFGPLSWGGKIILARNSLEGIADQEWSSVRLINTVPSLMETWLRIRPHPPLILTVNLAGEFLKPSLVEAIHSQWPVRRVNDLYGPTETTIYSTWTTREPGKPATIGRPISNTRIYVLDASLNPVPCGMAGDLYISGAGVARGYLNQPELTRERFIPDPFSSNPGDRLYRTGDRVRWREDGNIEFLGRLDQQVKIRGFRVEMGEIESSLCVIPGVREAVVVQREGSNGEPILVAYLVGIENETLASDEIRRQLRGRLPEYMIPSAFVFLARLPLMPNGKLDRHNLPDPGQDGHQPSPESGQAKDLIELELIRIWERLFHRSGIGRNDNFFELGGHSLLAARLAAALEKLLGCHFSIAALFQTPTVALLARRITDEKWAPPWSSLVPLHPCGTKPPLFFVHGVGGDVFAFLELAKALGPDQPVYGIQAVGLDGKVERHTSVEAMASHYVREILSFQPEGPYQLGGYSMGGSFAYEMARQLHVMGRKVSLLALFDSVPNGIIPWSIHVQALACYVVERSVLHLKRFWHIPRSEKLDFVCGRLKALNYWIHSNRAKPLPPSAVVSLENHPPPAPGIYDYYPALATAYRMNPYQGSADVFMSESANHHWISTWRRLVRGGVFYHQITGGHLEILKSEHLPTLAKVFTTVIESRQETENTIKAGDVRAG